MGMEFNSTQTIWMQIVDWVFEQILTAAWKPGDKAKSVRELAVMFEVNPNTVMRSYDYLQQREIIVNRRGIGFYVAPEAKEVIMAIRKKQFMEVELPLFFKNITLLDIPMEEVMQQYKEYKQ